MFYRVILRAPNGDHPRQINGYRNPSGVYASLQGAKNARAQLLPNPHRRYYSYRDLDVQPTRHVVIQRLYVVDNNFKWVDVDVRID